MNGSMPKVYGTNFGLALPTELLGKVILVAKFPMERWSVPLRKTRNRTCLGVITFPLHKRMERKMPNPTYTFVYSHPSPILVECRRKMVQVIDDICPKW